MISVERQVRALLRAWPIPDRSQRGEEIIGTTLDLLPSGETMLPLDLAINLIVGGVAARRRMRPPLWRWLHYRMGGRLSTRWQKWMLNDLSTPGWRRRILTSQIAAGFAALGLVWTIMPLVIQPHQHLGSFAYYPVGPTVGFVVGTLVFPRKRTDKFRNRQLTGNDYGFYRSPQDAPWPPPTGAPYSGVPQDS